jgi:hypothetical protein
LCVKGVPQVVLSKPSLKADLLDLGFIPGDDISADQPLMIVILKGDFNIGVPCMQGVKINQNEERTHVKYMAYVFDVRSGEALITMSSKNGGIFRKVLNDPTLPDDYDTTNPTSVGISNTIPYTPKTIIRPPDGTPLPTVQVTMLPTPVAKQHLPVQVPSTTPTALVYNQNPNAHGLNAIHPHLAVDNITNLAAFNESDITQYFSQTHPEWGFLTAETPITNEKVMFMPNRDIDKVLHKSAASMTGEKDDDMVCLVVAQGKFTVMGATIDKAFWVFDAKTGDLMSLGGY